MGHEIALQIKEARDRGEKLAIILPVGPIGMYDWVVYFLKSWGVSASHVHGFTMDEWSDSRKYTSGNESRLISICYGKSFIQTTW